MTKALLKTVFDLIDKNRYRFGNNKKKTSQLKKRWPRSLLSIEANENGTVLLPNLLYENENLDDAANVTLDSVDRDGENDNNDGSVCDIDDCAFVPDFTKIDNYNEP